MQILTRGRWKRMAGQQKASLAGFQLAWDRPAAWRRRMSEKRETGLKELRGTITVGRYDMVLCTRERLPGNALGWRIELPATKDGVSGGALVGCIMIIAKPLPIWGLTWDAGLPRLVLGRSPGRRGRRLSLAARRGFNSAVRGEGEASGIPGSDTPSTLQLRFIRLR